MHKAIRTLPGLRTLLLHCLAVASLGGTLATAQRPALVKNTDEPGRVPYEAEVEFVISQCFSNCINFSSDFDNLTLLDVNSPVPVGKRLIIRHISGALYSSGACGFCSVGLQSSQVDSARNLKWSFPGPFFGGTVIVGVTANAFSADLFVTVGPGELPHLRIVAPSLTNTVSNIVISGYLIDAT